jgi:hypothetical protein
MTSWLGWARSERRRDAKKALGGDDEATAAGKRARKLLETRKDREGGR